VRSLLPKIQDLDVRRLAIDEIAVMKGHKYLSMLRDYDTGVAVKVFFSRTYEATLEALESLGADFLKKIRHVVLDMWDPYIKAITEKCPQAELVFDKFHVVKKVNGALDKLRRKEFAKAEPEERKVMKKKRFVILKRNSNLSRSQRVELVELMKNNESLYKAYLLKEQLLSIFDDKRSCFAEIKERLIQWMESTLSSEIGELKEVVGTISGYFYGVLNYFRYGMTNAISEGFNTKINIIKRRAFGFRDIEYFILKIYQHSLSRLA
jgi:transposase